MSESWDQYAAGWDTNETVILYAEKAYKTLIDIINPAGLDVLDFGCGTGLLTEKIAANANHVLALDPSVKMLEVLKNKRLKNVETLSLELSQHAIKTNHFLQTQFDLIVASSVCAFVPDYEATLQLLKSLLKPKGIFVQWDWQQTESDSDFGFTKTMIETSFVNANLAVLSVSEVFSFASDKGEMQVLMGAAQKV
ncbi:MAG: class I SAM-dependent methyltransferase [Chloroflexota bacterium]